MIRIGQSSCGDAVGPVRRCSTRSSASQMSSDMRMSATLCCTSGWYAIECCMLATDVFCGIRATVMSKARLASAVVHARHAHQAPGEERAEATPGRRAGRRGPTETMSSSGQNALSRMRVLALRRPHAEGVPGVDDLEAGGVPGDEAVDDLRVVGIGVVLGVEPAVGPHRRQRAEDLVAGELPAAVDAGRLVVVEYTPGKSLPASPCRAQKISPSAAFSSSHDPRLVALLQQVGGDAGPVDVHVERQRRRRGDVAELGGQLRVLVEARGRSRRTPRAWRAWCSRSRRAPRSPR